MLSLDADGQRIIDSRHAQPGEHGKEGAASGYRMRYGNTEADTGFSGQPGGI